MDITWIKKNLFSNLFNTVLTIVSLILIYWIGSNLIYWVFNEAQWQVIEANLRLFFVGRYPAELIWRVWTVLGIIVSLGGISWGVWTQSSSLFNRYSLIILGIISASFVSISFIAGTTSTVLLIGMLLLLVILGFVGQKLGKMLPFLGNFLPLIWFISFFVVLWLLLGGLGILEPVETDDITGLLLTILVAVVSIISCFPFGVLLALGRQSSLPVVRWLSIAYIEVIRGLPLIGILFMAQVMLPLVLPDNIRPDRVIRAIAGFTIFSAAYIAENVRGGLQSVPKGQTEAAKALGLSNPLIIGLIVLPQALKAVIPAIVGHFISLFKDTSLLAIVGLVDLLGISRSILANPKYIGRYAEVYLFIALIYWLCCYGMSFASRRIEQKLDVS